MLSPPALVLAMIMPEERMVRYTRLTMVESDRFSVEQSSTTLDGTLTPFAKIGLPMTEYSLNAWLSCRNVLTPSAFSLVHKIRSMRIGDALEVSVQY
jgi:hypothetical protein